MPTTLQDIPDIGPRRPPPLPRPDAARVWAGFVLVVAGVVLIGLGGGALLGVMELLRMRGRLVSGYPPPNDDAIVLQNVLYGLAAACFAAAAVVLVLAIRGLHQILHQRNFMEDMP